jgi:hypothetical protein
MQRPLRLACQDVNPINHVASIPKNTVIPEARRRYPGPTSNPDATAPWVPAHASLAGRDDSLTVDKPVTLLQPPAATVALLHKKPCPPQGPPFRIAEAPIFYSR